MIFANYASGSRFLKYMLTKLGAFGASILGFAMVCFFLVRFNVFIVDHPSETETPKKMLESVFLLLAPAITGVGIFLSFVFFGFKVSKAPQYPKLTHKLLQIEHAFILFWACLGFVIAFNLLGYILTGNKIFLLFAFGAGSLIAFFHPSLSKCSRYLQLSDSESAVLESGNILEFDKARIPTPESRPPNPDL